MTAQLGEGASGPWEDRWALVRAYRNGQDTAVFAGARDRGVKVNPAMVGAWVNRTYSVQRFQHPGHEGIDHLLIKRHGDDETTIPWDDLQAIKDRLLRDGQFRWGLEYCPPTLKVVANHWMRHLWVMPRDWTPPIEFGPGVHV